MQHKAPRTLVIILAQTRSHELTFERFRRHVLQPLDATLAVCVSEQQQPGQGPDPFVAAAKHVFTHPEYADWGDAFEAAYQDFWRTARPSESPEPHAWRKVLNVRDQLFGGVLQRPELGDTYQHPGSAGILIAFRWLLLQDLQRAGLDREYDYFVVTRSDYLYLADHPRLPPLAPDAPPIWVPEGEDYGGITDRHAVIPRDCLAQALGLMRPILEEPDALVAEMSSRSSAWNLETFIRFSFQRAGILGRVQRFPRVMFAVRSPTASTRWAQGYYNAELGMIVKYDSELRMAQQVVREGAQWEAMRLPAPAPVPAPEDKVPHKRVHVVVARHRESLHWLAELLDQHPGGLLTATVYNDGGDDANDILPARLAEDGRVRILPGDRIPCEPSKYTAWILDHWDQLSRGAEADWDYVVFLQADPLYHNPTLLRCFQHMDKWDADFQTLSLYPHPPPWKWAQDVADGTAPGITWFRRSGSGSGEDEARVWNDLMDDHFQGVHYKDPFVDQVMRPAPAGVSVPYLHRLFAPSSSSPQPAGPPYKKCFSALFAVSPRRLREVGLRAWIQVDRFQRSGCPLTWQRTPKERAYFLEYMWAVLLSS